MMFNLTDATPVGLPFRLRSWHHHSGMAWFGTLSGIWLSFGKFGGLFALLFMINLT